MKHILLATFLLIASCGIAQKYNVLFLGNSYTYANDLPGTIKSLLVNTEHSLSYQSNAPGGYCFFQHVDNQTSLELIRQGNWDFVVLQEQSQMPSIDFYRYNCMYPAATQLRDSIKKYNPCADVVFYMTWGRRDGGQQCEDYGQGTYCSEAFSDYFHMQDTMTRSYHQITAQLRQVVAPAGEAWRSIKQSTDIELFSGDGSHPSIYGTYLTACVFYATFWKESPEGLPHPETITDDEALAMQRAASDVVFKSGIQWDFTDSLRADFKVRTDNQQRFYFSNTTASPAPMSCHWDFGDGNTSEEDNPTHDYAQSGTYNVRLTVHSCRDTDSITQAVTADIPTQTAENDMETISISPNPCHEVLHIQGVSEGGYTLFDSQGRMMEKGHIEGGNVSCHSLPSGIFFLKIDTKNGAKTLKFIHKSEK